MPECGLEEFLSNGVVARSRGRLVAGDKVRRENTVGFISAHSSRGCALAPPSGGSRDPPALREMLLGEIKQGCGGRQVLRRFTRAGRYSVQLPCVQQVKVSAVVAYA